MRHQGDRSGSLPRELTGRSRRVDEWKWLQAELSPFRVSQLISVGSLLVATLLSLVDPLIVKWIVDTGLEQRHWPTIWGAVGLFCAAYFGRILLLNGGNIILQRVIQQVMLRVRLRLLNRLQSMDADFYDRSPVGDLVHRLEQDVAQVGQVGASLFPTFVRIMVSVSVTLVVMAALDWRLSLMVLPFIPMLVLTQVWFRKVLEGAADAAREATGARAAHLTEILGGALQVQLLNATRFFYRRYGGLAIESARASLSQRRLELRHVAVSMAVIIVSTAVVLGAGAGEVFRGALTVGGYIAFYSYLLRLFDPLSSAVTTYASLKRAGGSVRRIAALEQMSPVMEDPENAAVVRASEVEVVELRDVSFVYGDGPQVLDRVSFAVRRGEKVALVGESGSGKSTLGRLILRIYDAGEGEVLFSGQNVQQVGMDSVRNTAVLVPSHPVLFRGTIRDNVLLGERGLNHAELDHFAQLVCFDTVLAKLADGWNHRLGIGGAGLSDGERQRLGLLRALVRDRDVMILDEATSALDPVVERKILTSLEHHLSNKITVLITHRVAPACWADRILLLREGRLEPLQSTAPEKLQDLAGSISLEIWGGARPSETGRVA